MPAASYSYFQWARMYLLRPNAESLGTPEERRKKARTHSHRRACVRALDRWDEIERAERSRCNAGYICLENTKEIEWPFSFKSRALHAPRRRCCDKWTRRNKFTKRRRKTKSHPARRRKYETGDKVMRRKNGKNEKKKKKKRKPWKKNEGTRTNDGARVCKSNGW